MLPQDHGHEKSGNGQSNETQHHEHYEPTLDYSPHQHGAKTRNLEPTGPYLPQAGASTDQPQFTADRTMAQTIVAEKLGPYQIITKLGQGGMGAVYKAIHSKLNKSVAIKVLPADRTRDRDAAMRFFREMKAVGKLRHRNIVQADDADEADGVPYLVMEYVDGLDISKLLKCHGPMSVADACELIRQSAVGLEHARLQGMVHRDIKPSNLMLTIDAQSSDKPSGVVKIMDLGLALLDNGHEHGSTMDELTASGQMMGTPDFMAPEQVDDSHKVDTRADVYSLGATLYKMLSGSAPFAGDAYNTPLKKMMALVNDEPPSISKHRNDLPGDLVRLITKMLNKNPDRRPATPGQIAELIRPFCSGNKIHRLLNTNGPVNDDPSVVATQANLQAGTVQSTVVIPPKPAKAQSKPSASRSGRWPMIMVGLAIVALVAVVAIVPGLLPEQSTNNTETVNDDIDRSQPVAPEPTDSPKAPEPIVAKPFSGETVEASEEWTELLTTIDPVQDALGDAICRSTAGGLEVDGSWFDCVRVPILLNGSYQLRVLASSTKGHLPNLVLPVGEKQAELQFARDRAVLRTSNARPVSFQFAHDKTYELLVIVEATEPQASIQLKVDGADVMDWMGSPDELVVDRRLKLDEKVIGLGVGGVSANVEAIQIKLTRGEARKLERTDEVAKTPRTPAVKTTTPQMPATDPVPRPVREIAGRYEFTQTTELKVTRGEVRRLWLSKDGKTLIAHDQITPTIHSVWDVEKKIKLHDIEIKNWADHAVLNDDGSQYFTATKSGKLVVWDVATGDKVHDEGEPRNFVGPLHFSPFDGSLYSMSANGTVLQINPIDCAITKQFDFKELIGGGRVYSSGLGTKSNEFTFATVTDVGLFQGEPLEKLSATVPADPDVQGIVISPDGKKVALKYRRGVAVREFGNDVVNPPFERGGYNLETRQIAWMPDSELLLCTGGGSGSARNQRAYLRLYDSISGKVMSANDGWERKAFPDMSIYSMEYHLKSGKVAIGSTTGMVYLFDVQARN